MTFEKFIKSMKYLSAAYPMFKLNMNDDYSLKVWHDVLKDFTDDQFIDTLKDYVKNNTFPPQSPASLIEWEKERIIRSLDVDGMFEKLVKRIREHAYDLEAIIDKYDKGGQHTVAKTIKDLYSDFQSWFKDGSQIIYLKKKFTDMYRKNIDYSIVKDLTTQDERLKLNE